MVIKLTVLFIYFIKDQKIFYLQVTFRCCLGVTGRPLLPEVTRHGWWAPRRLFQHLGLSQTSLPLPGSLPQWNVPLPVWCTYRNGHLHKSIPQPDSFVINFRESFLASCFYFHLAWAMTPCSFELLLYKGIFNIQSGWKLLITFLSFNKVWYWILFYWIEKRSKIDQWSKRYDQWQPLNISKSIAPEIYSFKRA